MKEYRNVEIFTGRELLDSMQIWGTEWEVIEKAKSEIEYWENNGYTMVSAKVDGEEVWS